MPALPPRLFTALLIAAGGHAAPLAAETTWPDPATSASEAMPRAAQSLLLDAVRLDGGRLIAVGERGHVVVSDDGGERWNQIVVPTRATLTAVAASGAIALAAGHDGVILRSADRGDSWQRVREEPFSPDNVASPSNGSPVLDVLFLDDNRVLAVGAYALVLLSEDGGASWANVELALDESEGDGTPTEETAAMSGDESTIDGESGDNAGDDMIDDAGSDAMMFSDDDLLLDDEADPHLNALARTPEGVLLMAGERGSLFRSRDDGASWQRLTLPYGGSMFGVLAPGGGRIVVMGLRGRAFESDDLGDNWRELDTGVQATLFAGTVAADGALALVGAQGAILRRASGASGFERSVFVTDAGETPTHSAVLATDDGQLMLFGERGVARWRRP